MAKQGMKRPEFDRKKNDVPPVPEISGKAKHGHNPTVPLIAGENGKVWHGTPYAGNDLAVDNMMGYDRLNGQRNGPGRPDSGEAK